MLHQIIVIISALPILLFSFSVEACDSKSCESAYLISTERYIANHQRRARTMRAERVAYSKNRERRDYALYVHKHFTLAGRKHLERL